jgi:hypothetical protein
MKANPLGGFSLVIPQTKVHRWSSLINRVCVPPEWFNDARQIASDHPDLTGGLESEFGYVKGSVFATLEIGEQRHLEEIARLVDKHLKKVHDDELARMTKDAANKD